MNFKELQDKIGTQIESDWHQHKNGNGWVHKNAVLEESCFVSENAIMFSGKVSGNARVYGNAQVFGDAWVSGNARVYGNAQVFGDAWDKSPLFIIGSKHSLTNCKKGFIRIGCHCKKIDWWLENFEDIGKKENYTPDEIKEYGAYIRLFKEVGK